MNLNKNVTIFISHSNLDESKAMAVYAFLKSFSINAYIDKIDKELQTATEMKNSKEVVKCIEKGIRLCSHILVIITENTRGSWWVPYEIGMSKALKKECGHLIDKQLTEIPEFISIGKVLTDAEEILEWLYSYNYNLFEKHYKVNISPNLKLSKTISGIDSHFIKHKIFYNKFLY